MLTIFSTIKLTFLCYNQNGDKMIIKFEGNELDLTQDDIKILEFYQDNGYIVKELRQSQKLTSKEFYTIKSIIDLHKNNFNTEDIVLLLTLNPETAYNDIKNYIKKIKNKNNSKKCKILSKIITYSKIKKEYDFAFITDYIYAFYSRKKLIIYTYISMILLILSLCALIFLFALFPANQLTYTITYLVVVLIVILVAIYLIFRNLFYICLSCHTRFRPRFFDFLFAMHFPRSRELRCPHCGIQRYQLELLNERKKKVKKNNIKK